jgi:hypothetical protein
MKALGELIAAGFGAAYAGMRVILVLQYLRARRVPATSPGLRAPQEPR